MDISSLFSADDDDLTAQEKAAAMVAALRGQEARGQLMSMHPLLQGVGQSMAQSAQTGQNQLVDAGKLRAGQRLTKAMAQQQQQFQSSETDKRLAAEAEQNRLDRLHRIKIEQMHNHGAGAGSGMDPLTYQLKLAELEKKRQDITGEDPKKVKAAEQSAQRMRGLVAQMKTLHSKHGTEFVGAHAEKMKQLQTAIQMEAKNLAELGALSGPDLQLVESLQGSDPTSLWSNIKGLVTGGIVDNTQQSLDTLNNWVDGMEGAARATFGGSQGQPQRQESPAVASEDSEALAWAKANPNDPRSVQILRSLGVK